MLTFSNCKINIGLDVVRSRPDGYHDISTCMLPVPWHDVIEAVPACGPESSLTVLGRHIDCPAEKNLVMKAYRILEKEFGLPALDIVLQKIVPDGAGLGGGSSDATHTLRLINSMMDLGLTPEDIALRAARLGADCAFFAYDRPMIAEGVGDVLSPIDLPLCGCTIVIAKPESVSISTAAAYRGISVRPPEQPLRSLLQLPVEQWQGRVKNDFEESIFPLAPQIADLKRSFIDHGASYASMSGSGSSVYGIFKDASSADSATALVEELPHFSFRIE